MSNRITINLEYLLPDQLEALIKLVWGIDEDAMTSASEDKILDAYRKLNGQAALSELMRSIANSRE